MSDAVRAEKIAHEVDDAARQLAQAGRLDLTREFIQHGDVTVYAHVTSVARASLSFAEHLGRAGISIDRASLLRGALLHDYFLYDWHDPDRAIDCTDFDIRFLPWHVRRKILS